jgi:asparagine synthase (glutamine-hydrolysing)
MCGIAGSTNDPSGGAVRAMSATLRHRGPDDEGLYTDSRTGVSIGVRRLAILDLSGGHQPLSNEDGSVWVVFNGEIYNYPQLRQQLLARGHHFATNCDTEVLVHLYEEFGEAMVHALEGMFAFALWDERRQRLLLARDRFGEKPLFVHESGGNLLFASELTALFEVKPELRELEPGAVDAFFVLGYVPGPGTIVPGVRQLPPGCLLTWEREGHHTEQRSWWAPPEEPSGRLHEPFGALVAEAERLFTDSVRTRMIADVPVGVFLSGGIDSTLVTSAAAQASSRQVKTFTIGYDVGSFDETSQARRVAERLGTEHHEVVLTEAEVGARAPAMLASLDQPLADQAMISLHALSEFARPLVTVALGGEGADELFGGYPRYRWIERAGRLESALPVATRSLGGLVRHSGRWSGAQRLLERAAPSPLLERHLDWVTGGRRHRRESLYGPRLAAVGAGQILAGLDKRAGSADGPSPGRRLMRLDQVDYLPDDVLVKTDRASMLASLEIRTVYLHRGLAEFAASTDSSLHLGGRGKTLLHAMLPPGMDTPRRPSRFRKAAFRAPTAEWLRGPLAPVLRDQVRGGAIFEQGWFERDAADRLLREHAAGECDHSDVLWPLLSLGLWGDRIFGRDAA